MERQKSIAISGATGLVGSYLVKFFWAEGWEVMPLSRGDFLLTTDQMATRINGVDAIVHLAGAPVLQRWSRKNTQEIYDSRILTTRKLSEAISICETKPRIFISASAVGIYDSIHLHAETSSNYDSGYLGKVCIDWESEAMKAEGHTIVVVTRLGVVLASRGGALRKMLLPFKLGIGGKIGNGKQFFPWIHIEDVVGAIDFIIQHHQALGIYNLVSPQGINNKQFTAALAKSLHRPTFLPIPAYLLKLIYGKAAVTLTTGQHVIPNNLERSGYKFRFPTVEAALSNLVSEYRIIKCQPLV